MVTALGVLLNIPLQPAGQPRPQPQGQPKPQSQPQPQPKSPEKSTDLPLEKQQAEQEKELGNQEYKQRNYEAALAHYSRAIELNPDELAYRSNKAGELSFSNSFTFQLCIWKWVNVMSALKSAKML